MSSEKLSILIDDTLPAGWPSAFATVADEHGWDIPIVDDGTADIRISQGNSGPGADFGDFAVNLPDDGYAAAWFLAGWLAATEGDD